MGPTESKYLFWWCPSPSLHHPHLSVPQEERQQNTQSFYGSGSCVSFSLWSEQSLQTWTPYVIPPKSSLVNWWVHWCYLQDQRWRVACRNMGDSMTAVAPKSPPQNGWRLPESCIARAPCIICRQLSLPESPLFSYCYCLYSRGEKPCEYYNFFSTGSQVSLLYQLSLMKPPPCSQERIFRVWGDSYLAEGGIESSSDRSGRETGKDCCFSGSFTIEARPCRVSWRATGSIPPEWSFAALCVHKSPREGVTRTVSFSSLRGAPGWSFLSAFMVGVHMLDLEKFLVLELEAPESEATILLPFAL